MIVYFTEFFHIFFDKTMMQNVLETNWSEAQAFLDIRLLIYIFLLGVTPSYLLWKIKLTSYKILRSAMNRLLAIVLAISVLSTSVLCIYPQISWMFRQKSELRYLLTPFNLITNTLSFSRDLMNESHQPIQRLDPKAFRGQKLAGTKPRLIVIVVGETVRAANWGLNGYVRQTTPKLGQHDIINFSNVKSCGTTTAVSVPCMFSPFGQHAYNARKIKNTESLLHLLNRVGINILWRDNQSGCKGVCDGLPYEQIRNNSFCHGHDCFDEALLEHFEETIVPHQDMLLVLHMMGNHGPAYYQRYPKAFEQWRPICNTEILSNCTQQEIVNAYDNIILYTDNILSHLIERLSQISSHDTGLIFLSDHGESLGENNLFLHGVPYAFAPKVQKSVPMFLWLSSNLLAQLEVKKTCLQNQRDLPLSHDYLFPTILSLFDVKTIAYDANYDLLRPCRDTI